MTASRGSRNDSTPRWLVALAIVSLAHVSTTAAAAQDILPYQIHEERLANGMRIVAVPYDSPGIVAFYLVVRTGSRDEVESGHSGFAHFFEHMMFRAGSMYDPPGKEGRSGTAKRSFAELTGALYPLAAQINV